jgi:hypothetical protein
MNPMKSHRILPGIFIILVMLTLLFAPTMVFAQPENSVLFQQAQTDTAASETASAIAASETASAIAASQTSAAQTASALTPSPTATITSTPQPDTTRPMIVLREYSISSGTASSGNNITLKVNLRNQGSASAKNVRVQFASGDFIPLQNGGLQVYNGIGADNGVTVEQDMQVSYGIWGSATQTIQVSYNAPTGEEYAETFTLYFNTSASSNTVYATSTPTIMPRPNLIISGYGTDIEDLQAGYIFNLNLDIENQGNSEASNIMMVLGGSVTTTGEGSNSEAIITQDDFKNFAPLESSNIHNLGNIYPGSSMSFSQKLVVNTTTEPGAYPLKITFVYDDKNGNKVMDHQVVTLLIYALPKVSTTFYRETGPIFSGQETMLPIQITNTGKKSAIFGELNITSDGAMILNGTSTIGSLESGGYFTIDPTVLFAEAGLHKLEFTIEYTDDFNQERLIEQSITVDVEEQPVMDFEPPMGQPDNEEFYMPEPEEMPETFLQKTGRFIKGFFGLGSKRG